MSKGPSSDTPWRRSQRLVAHLCTQNFDLNFELYKNLRPQADLWAFYLEASVYGQEVFTCGGARGPAHAYFVPLLSGLQLFASVPPGEMGEMPDPPPAGGERLFACDGGE